MYNETEIIVHSANTLTVRSITQQQDG